MVISPCFPCTAIKLLLHFPCAEEYQDSGGPCDTGHTRSSLLLDFGGARDCQPNNGAGKTTGDNIFCVSGLHLCLGSPYMKLFAIRRFIFSNFIAEKRSYRSTEDAELPEFSSVLKLVLVIETWMINSSDQLVKILLVYWLLRLYFLLPRGAAGH
ncbi:hypothetical protein Dimus_030028 [Dionaea muscipula]